MTALFEWREGGPVGRSRAGPSHSSLWPPHIWYAAGETIHIWHDRAVARRQLAELDDRTLLDIGLTRAEVEREAEKPFWIA